MADIPLMMVLVVLGILSGTLHTRVDKVERDMAKVKQVLKDQGLLGAGSNYQSVEHATPDDTEYRRGS